MKKGSSSLKLVVEGAESAGHEMVEIAHKEGEAMHMP